MSINFYTAYELFRKPLLMLSCTFFAKPKKSRIDESEFHNLLIDLEEVHWAHIYFFLYYHNFHKWNDDVMPMCLAPESK